MVPSCPCYSSIAIVCQRAQIVQRDKLLVNLSLEFFSGLLERIWKVRVDFNSVLVSGGILTHENGSQNIIIVHISLFMENF